MNNKPPTRSLHASSLPRFFTLRTPEPGYDWSCWQCSESWRSNKPDSPPPTKCPKCGSGRWWWEGTTTAQQSAYPARLADPQPANVRADLLPPPPSLHDNFDNPSIPVYADHRVEPQPENLISSNEVPQEQTDEPAEEVVKVVEPVKAAEPTSEPTSEVTSESTSEAVEPDQEEAHGTVPGLGLRPSDDIRPDDARTPGDDLDRRPALHPASEAAEVV